MRRWAPWAAGLLFVVAIASWFLGIVVSSGAGFSVDDVIWASAFMGFPIVGLLLAARRPDHPLGWCWLAGVTALGLGVNLQSIAESVWFPVQTASWAGWVALVGAILVPPAFGLIAFPATFYLPGWSSARAEMETGGVSRLRRSRCLRPGTRSSNPRS